MAAETFSDILKSNPTKADEDQSFSIFKTDDDKRLVFGWASIVVTVEGEQLEDRQKDIIDPEDLEEAAYEYVLNFRDTGEEHISSMRKKGKLVESCVFTEEKQRAMGIPAGTLPVGWWIGFKIEDDAAWARVKNGTYKMFSIEGKANRIPVEKAFRNFDEFPEISMWYEENMDATEEDIEAAREYYAEKKKQVEKSKLIGCGVLVIQDGKILSGTRIERGGRGKICGPGGHIEEGETPEEAAKREAYEEFGIECHELTSLGTLEDGTSAIFLCEKFSGTPKTDEKEMTDPQWRTIEELQEEDLYHPFEQSLEAIEEYNSRTVAKTFEEILKFNPFHDARGRFASSNSFASYSANPKTKAGAMAISRSAQAGHGTTFNSHKESQGENINQNYRWLNGGPGAKQLSAQGQLASQQPKQPPKPTKNYDKLGYADHDDADYHQLYNGRQYYQQQKLTASQQKAAANYLEDSPEPGSLYSHSQNMNYQMANGQTLTGKYKQTHDGLMDSMHNIGYNVELTRYDHAGMVDGILQGMGIGKSYEKMSQSALKKALVGAEVQENKFLSASYNGFKNAPQSTKQIFDSRAVKINYKVKANTQAMMPGKGPGGDFGEIILAPTNGKANKGGKITDVRLTGQMVRRKGTQTYDQPRIEIDIEIG